MNKRDERRDTPVRIYPLGQQPGDDLSGVTTAGERLAMVWSLTVEVWSLSGRPLPDPGSGRSVVQVLRLEDLGHRNEG